MTGYGECDPWPLFTGDIAEATALILEKSLAPMLIGRDPCNINEIHMAMDTAIRNQRLTKSAVDMAAYDILGKATGMPVHRLLGGKRRDGMKVMWSIGVSEPEQSAREALASKEQGYVGCMIKVGADCAVDAARTIAAREAVGPDFPLIADANQGWDADTAIRYAGLVKNCGLLFFEQPVQSWDVDGMARVRRAISMPLSADESVATLQDAMRLIKAEAADVFSIKVTKHGGIREAKAICDYAAVNGIRVFFNSMIEEGITQAASLALGVTSSNIVETIGHAYFSPLRLEGDICSYHTLIGRGFVSAPDAPGLGVEPYPEKIAQYRVHSATVTRAHAEYV